MWVFMILLLTSFPSASYQKCSGGRSICQHEPWSTWSSCSRSCGGGSQTRSFNMLCCKSSIAHDRDACMRDCGIPDDFEKRRCNIRCDNRGSFHYDNYDSSVYFNYGHCICPEKYGGRCCEEPNCGWDSKWCWPGSCSSSHYYNSNYHQTNYEEDCRCDSGFRKETIGSETKCQLDAYRTASRPKLETCRAGLETSNRDAVNTTTIGPCSGARSIYTNLQPAKLSFTIESSFSINVSSDSKKNRIKHWSFGIVENAVKVLKKPLAGSSSQLDTKTLQGPPSCNVPFSDRNPNPMVVSCTGELTHTTRLSDGESICVDFIAYAGGFLTTQDSVTDTYKRTESRKELCFMYDDSAPTHCVGSKACTTSMLHLDQRITSNPDIHVEFSSWYDPIPAGGSTTHASGISKFIVELLRVVELDKTTLQMKYPSLVTKTKGPRESSTDITLPAEPALYTVVLEVHDEAGNVGRARRFVLYDNSSTVALFGDKNLWSSSASSQTNYTWQTQHGRTCFNWTGRYYNTYHLNYNLLRAIKTADSISPDYDQMMGPMPVSGTPNINGIVQFDYTWKLNNQSYQPYKTIGNFFSQSFCEDLRPSDGQSYTFQIKPIDINSGYLTEKYALHVDQSPPDIDNIRLMEDGYIQLSIQTISDLAETELHFEAMDIHSGLNDSIQWTLGTDEGRDVVAGGHIAVDQIDGSCVEQECYCPKIGKCENYLYKIDLHKELVNATPNAPTNREYIFTLIVSNNAGLFNIEHMNISVDDSLPSYTGGLNVSVEFFDDKIYCSWRNDTFVDEEQMHTVDFVIFKIGSQERFYTPMLKVPPGERCPRSEMFGCVRYPLHKLQRHVKEEGLSFYFELYVYNISGHFTTVQSDLFTIPSPDFNDSSVIQQSNNAITIGISVAVGVSAVIALASFVGIKFIWKRRTATKTTAHNCHKETLELKDRCQANNPQVTTPGVNEYEEFKRVSQEEAYSSVSHIYENLTLSS